jgi:uncharacterized protein with HEPN domain
MKNDPRANLLDIRDALDRIEQYTEGGKDVFLADEKTQDAVIYNLAIIGEAVKGLPAPLRSRYPSIPWKSVAGMRDIVIHDYNGTDVATIWNAVERDLPRLRRTTKRMLPETKPAVGRRNSACKPRRATWD